MARIAINGMGRIGRATFKIAMDTPDLDIVAVNDLASPENLAYLLRYDSVYGRYAHKVHAEGSTLVVDGARIPILHEKDPAKLPWRELDVDTVLECTGVFDSREGLMKHIQAGARFAILSADAKGTDVPTVVYGVNAVDDGGQPDIRSCASCTTNAITPLLEIIGRRIGVKKSIMTTVHAYTATQALVDGPSSGFTRGRAGGLNIVPTSTGAARAAVKALPEFKGRFDGVGLRVPVPAGSIADVVFLTERPTTVEEVNNALREESNSKRYRGIVGFSDEALVSTDILQDTRACVVEAGLTRVVDGDLVKIMAWYDNEWGYANQMVRETVHLARGVHADVDAA